MASLRRIASLDKSDPCSSLNPVHCVHRLIRHSSLPNLFLGQPELSIKADGLRPRNHDCKRGLPHSIGSSNSRTLSHTSKLSLCRALFTNSSDELSCFEIPTADARGRFSLHPNVLPVYDSRGFEKSPARMEAQLLAAGKKSTVDVEKSIVYNELKKSLWKFEAPPRFLSPSHVEGSSTCAGINTHRHTHDIQYEASTRRQDIRTDCTRSDVKGRPLSLQMLKRKSSKVSTSSKPSFKRQPNQNCPPQGATPNVLTGAGDSVSSAFTSLFYVMEMLQQCALSLCMRSRPPFFETEYRSSQENSDVRRACTELLESFLWLFQQVFSCTPRLMLLTMVLLADFTLHSMSMHVAFPVMTLGEPSTSTHSPSHKRRSEAADPFAHQISHPRSEGTCKSLIMPCTAAEDQCSDVTVAGEGGRGPGHVDVKTRHGAMKSEDPHVRQPKEVTGSRGQKKPLSEFLSGRDLDGPTKRMLVAPVRAPILEADDYPCFDQTDLAYQREISADPTNPLLLANYAQFLHLVRHDHNRAEELFKKAVRVEAEVDGELMGKFGSFLWVAKGDLAEADRAFKAAAMADPSNAFHAGNYAHFLWNSSAQAEEMPTNCFNSNANISS